MITWGRCVMLPFTTCVMHKVIFNQHHAHRVQTAHVHSHVLSGKLLHHLSGIMLLLQLALLACCPEQETIQCWQNPPFWSNATPSGLSGVEVVSFLKSLAQSTGQCLDCCLYMLFLTVCIQKFFLLVGFELALKQAAVCVPLSR